MDKRGLEFSFAWIFAILVGAFILFLAIYAAINLISTQQYAGQTKLAKEITIIFNPMETGLASGKSTPIKLSQDTRIYNKCFIEGSFGREEFSVSQKSGFGKKWPDAGGGISVYNKYVFSSEIQEGKIFYFFSKPFKMPFKVSEIILMMTEEYCFVNAPEFVDDEIKNQELKNIKTENCTGKEIKVCFDENCDISIYGDCRSSLCNSEYDYGHVIKNGDTVYYADSLIYAGIFSSPEIYKCNFERLMKRIEQISYLYYDEANFLVSRGCGNAMTSGLIKLAQVARNTNPESLSAIENLKQAANDLDNQNSGAKGECGIYES